MSTASWGLLDLDTCPSCREMTFLWTHSLANNDYFQGQMERCLPCHRSNLGWFSRSSDTDRLHFDIDHLLDTLRSLPDLPFITEFAMCGICDGPIPRETTDTRYNAIDAGDPNDRTIIVQVHQKCSIKCVCCSTTYPWANGWSRDGRTVQMFKYDSDENDGLHCKPCFQAELGKVGLSQDDTILCPSCEYYIHTDNAQRYRGDYYCEPCFDRNTFRCNDCNELLWDGDDHDCSHDSPDDEYEGLIHDYSYKPRPYFFGEKEGERLFFGFELEVEAKSGDRRSCAESVQNSLGERVYLKNDGSLNNGFEIVTHPHTLEAYHKEFRWESFTKFRKLGMRSWDTSTCGLHVHVSREAFGIPYDNRTDNYTEHIRTRQTHEIKFIKLIYDNSRQIQRLAGRSSPDYANFLDKGRITLKVKHDDTSGGRNAAVNTFNENTLEVRVFKGSLIPERVLSAIELVHSAVEYTRNLNVMESPMKTSNGKIKSGSLSWLAFCSYIYKNNEQYPNLFATMVKSFDSDIPTE